MSGPKRARPGSSTRANRVKSASELNRRDRDSVCCVAGRRRDGFNALVDFDVVIDPASRPSAASSAPEISFDPSYDLENSSDRFNSSGDASLRSGHRWMTSMRAKSARLFSSGVPRGCSSRGGARTMHIDDDDASVSVSVSIARNGSSSLGNGTNAWSFRVPARASTTSSSFIHRAWFSSLSSADSI